LNQVTGLFGLSKQEQRVLELITEGLADKEIAAQLGVTPYTINKHVGRILEKTESRSRTGAAIKAIRSGMFCLWVFALDTGVASAAGLLAA
jgi:DNA-binding NarL/FixJ family response regulator